MSLHGSAADVVSLKLAAFGSAIATILSLDASTALIGVPLNVLFAGLCGSFLGIAYAPVPETRARTFCMALVNAFLAACLSAILPHVPGLNWLAGAPASAIAVILGIVARWAVPVVLKRANDIFDGVLRRFGIKEGPQ